MTDINRALNDIALIRNQIADVQLFRGFGPLVIGLTGLLALVLSAFQDAYGETSIIVPWIVLACISAALIGVEMWALTRRENGVNAYDLLWAIVQKFLPCLAAGAGIGWIIVSQEPRLVWLLPGLWQVLIGLGLFAAASMLPRNVMFAAAWYFVVGLLVLLLSAQNQEITPWAMGVPFGFGQILLACLLYWAPETRRGVS